MEQKRKERKKRALLVTPSCMTPADPTDSTRSPKDEVPPKDVLPPKGLVRRKGEHVRQNQWDETP